jgi:CRISPR system Cascade subunit CasA
MNLLFDHWVPVHRSSGARERIAPWQVTDSLEDDPVTRLAAPRADFDGALAQFLVGLLQTTLAPEDGRSWSERLDRPPKPEALRNAFEPIAPYFELFGEGARFLQDRELDAHIGKEKPIERLLIDSPGGSTVSLGIDHFVKGGRVNALCQTCAACALLTLQLNAPAGGQGHRTGLRGGGPVTTLVLYPGGGLWRTLWMNVLPAGELVPAAAGREASENTFPWLGPTRTSEGGRETSLSDVHPLQMFWSMPRRIRLAEPAADPEHGPCDLCDEEPGTVSSYLTKNLGVNYAGEWRHPLTPRYLAKTGELLPVHGSPDGIGHRHWLGLAVNPPDGSRQIAPVVRAVYEDHRRAEAYRELRLWAFGYDMDNKKPMKARSWAEGEMPVYPVPPELIEQLGRQVEHLIQSEELSAAALRRAIKSAISDRPEDLSGDPLDAGLHFWQEMENPFLGILGPLVEEVRRGNDPVALRQEWHRNLVNTASRVFERATEAGQFRGRDPRRVAEAWNGLRRTLYGPKILKALELPPPPKKTSRSAASGSAETTSTEISS